MLRFVYAFLLLSASAALAQTTGTATLVGAVTDSSGAGIAGAKVTVQNVETSVSTNTTTSAAGDYYVPYLNSGNYRLSVEAAGFKRYLREGIQLRINETPRLDVQMEIGAVTESINVVGAPPLLETENSATGKILEGETIVKIPVMQKFVHRLAMGEFGRVPGNLNPGRGRDHHLNQAVLVAGAGIKGPKAIGTTDRDGRNTADPGWERKRDIRTEDVEATIYSALGIDYSKVLRNEALGARGFEYVPFSDQDLYGPVHELWD